MQQVTTDRRTLTTEDDLYDPKLGNKGISHRPPSEMPSDVVIRHEFLRWVARMLQKKGQRAR
ncbi:MAG: hypothetical protein P8Y78_03075 [Acidihalobacter sp.]